MSLGPMEIGLLLLVMLFVFGPKRIPEIGKSIGDGLSAFRKANTTPALEEKSEKTTESTSAATTTTAG